MIKRTSGFGFLWCVLLVSTSWSAPTKQAPKKGAVVKKTPQQVQLDYADKVKPLAKEIIIAWPSITIGVMQFSNSGSDQAVYELRSEVAKAKSAVKKLQTITPVPKSFKDIDDNFGRFTEKSSTGLDMIVEGLKQKDSALVSAGESVADEGYEFFSKAYDELTRRTKAIKQNKKYVDG